jgi:hypothetical protein
MGKDRRSHDQKRKAKLAERNKRERDDAAVTPYAGRKYQADAWVPHMFHTERAVYETILLSQEHLTNPQTREAFVQLIKHLQDGHPAALTEAEAALSYAPGAEVQYLIWNIRRHWGLLFDEQGPVSTEDLIGILRTLLNSIEAHAWNTGAARGYVVFLKGFMERTM